MEETLLAASSSDNSGAVAALRQVIQANSPHRLSSQTVEWVLGTRASGVSADSEDYIRNPYTDLGSRPPKRKNESVKSESPVAVSPPQSVNSVGDEDLEVISPDEGDQAPPALTRPRAASSPVRGDRSQSSGSMVMRSVRTW
ncbi:hypothetical protein J7T55_008335 [Diaporthe amygdali]|uniref:uncharacterized protein n=1 Tax=Phomopsis amygdali TaxID=1214568 RepID=UPI0022FEAD2D|nr:uncharacterized protein J7T55_008335 [Diaporthe amygdali]KAJ0121173.1 hypothetical protein J7T55_008335 [Diaporthe amygdali]